jgi:hypothetical protein
MPTSLIAVVAKSRQVLTDALFTGVLVHQSDAASAEAVHKKTEQKNEIFGTYIFTIFSLIVDLMW